MENKTGTPELPAEAAKLIRHLLKQTTLPVQQAGKQGIDLEKLSRNGTLVKDTLEQYLETPDHISSSALKEVLKTPLHYYYYTQQTFKQETKKCFELGAFAHMAFLDPERFDQCIVEPDIKMNSSAGVDRMLKFWEGKIAESKDCYFIFKNAFELIKQQGLSVDKIDGKRAYIELLRSTMGFTVVNEEQKEIIDLMKRHYHTYGGGIIPLLLHGAEKQVSFYGADKDTGFKVKIRPDAFNMEENCGVNCIISFKTTAAAELDKFIYDTVKFKYDLSEAMYQEVASQVTGRRFDATITIMLQTTPPYLPAVFWWSAGDIADGKHKYRQCMNLVKECYEKKLFPGFDAVAGDGNYGIIELKQHPSAP